MEGVLLWLLIGVVAGFAITSLALWIRAEIDERRWRRTLDRMREER